MNIDHGTLTISLDFELYWGVRDKRSITQYEGNLRGVKNAVDQMLQVFGSNDVHATWATVGFLFFKDKEELKKYIPKHTPSYLLEKLSPYSYIQATEKLDKEFHFAPEIIENIKNIKGQEIGTHTFSHYYCLEEGQSLIEFEEDIASAIKIAQKKGVAIKSLVFPRNQWNPQYLEVLAKYNLTSYRGNESTWMYQASDNESQSKLQRAARLLDSYLNLTGFHTYDYKECLIGNPFNIPASRFLRPYSKKLAILDDLRLKRITSAMDDAAINKKIFHLWWHPHNFGVNTKENIDFLRKIISHYNGLKQKYGMKSLSMAEISELSQTN